MKELIKRMLRFLWYRRGYREKILNIEFSTIFQFKAFCFVYYRRAIKRLRRLYAKYGENCTVCVCPYKGTGDVYLAAAYFKDSVDDT